VMTSEIPRRRPLLSTISQPRLMSRLRAKRGPIGGAPPQPTTFDGRVRPPPPASATAAAGESRLVPPLAFRVAASGADRASGPGGRGGAPIFSGYSELSLVQPCTCQYYPHHEETRGVFGFSHGFFSLCNLAHVTPSLVAFL
jgi:hypothetical protein